MENRVFVDDVEVDLDRIDVIPSESNSTHSEPQSLGSRNLLTGKDTNFRFTSESPNPQEYIELATNAGDPKRRKSSLLNVSNLGDGRVPTPTNMVRRWSQSISRFSKDKRSIRERTIYRLPSRQVFEVDGKLISADPDAELEQLVQEIEQHDYLMQDTALSKQSRLETLRALPQKLAVKRLLKAQLSITIEQQTANETQTGPKKCLKRCLNGIMGALLKFWNLLGTIYYGLEIWYNALKTIEGHFGSNVSSYFKFLRWLFAFNVLLFIFPLSFITLPQALYNDEMRWQRSNERSYINGKNDTLDINSNSDNEDVLETNGTWSYMDFLTGEGALQNSVMFYGSYSNASFSYRNSKSTYSIPNAYYMTMLLLYLSIFVFISTSMARSYRKSFIETSGGVRSLCAAKIFCSWDYGISDRKAAELKHFAVYTELKEVLSELCDPKITLSIWWRVWIFCSQMVAHILVFVMVAGAGIAIWIALKQLDKSESNNSSWDMLYVAAIVNVSVLVLQTIFSWISKMEDYRSPRHTLHITLVRNFLLESIVIGVLVYYWLSRNKFEGWETAIGQEIYRLIISDCFISLFVVPLLSCFRVFIVLRFIPKCEHPEFDISQKSLGLVFNQTLLWIGLFFAPLLAAVMIVKLILLFYINKAMLMYMCKSPRHVWRSAQTQTLYLVFTFLSLLGVIIALGYIMTQLRISQKSGPFRDHAFMFQIFIDGVLQLRKNHTIWTILMIMIRPAVVGGILIIMSIMVYYLRAKSRAHCMMVKLLKEMIYLEAKDKEFLLAGITNIKKDRKWYVNGKETDITTFLDHNQQAEASGTWRYTRKRRGNISLHGSSVSMESATSIVSTIDECVLRNRNA